MFSPEILICLTVQWELMSHVDEKHKETKTIGAIFPLLWCYVFFVFSFVFFFWMKGKVDDDKSPFPAARWLAFAATSDAGGSLPHPVWVVVFPFFYYYDEWWFLHVTPLHICSQISAAWRLMLSPAQMMNVSEACLYQMLEVWDETLEGAFGYVYRCSGACICVCFVSFFYFFCLFVFGEAEVLMSDHLCHIAHLSDASDSETFPPKVFSRMYLALSGLKSCL